MVAREPVREPCAPARRTRMRLEIEEVPLVVERILDRGVTEAATIAATIRGRAPRTVVIVGRGSSHHAGVYTKYMVETFLGLPAALGAPSVITQYRAQMRWEDVLVLALSQSGRSPDVCSFVEAARRGGATSVAISNHVASPLARAAELVIDCRAGEELSVPATKTFAAELTLAAALVLELAGSDRISVLTSLPTVLRETIARAEDWLLGGDPPVRAIVASRRAIVLGRGYNLATALEVGLKLKEAAGVFAEASSTAELLHGPAVLAAPDVPVIVFERSGPTRGPEPQGIVTGDGRQTRWIVGTDARPPNLALPEIEEWATPIPYALAGQLLAERVALMRGLDPDHPPGLSKITRTV